MNVSKKLMKKGFKPFSITIDFETEQEVCFLLWALEKYFPVTADVSTKNLYSDLIKRLTNELNGKG